MLSKSRNIRLLALHNFFLDFRPYAPVEVLYYFQITGSYRLSLLVLSILMLSASVAEVPTGILSDMVGRKKTLILGSAYSALGLLLYAMAHSFGVLAAGAICIGISRSFFSGNNNALLYDTLRESRSESQYSEWLGKTSSMFQVGLGLSALAGGWIAGVSFVWVMWVSVVPQVICLLLSFFFHEPRVHTKESTNIFGHLDEALKRFRASVKLRLLSLATILDFGIGQTMFPFSSAFVALFWPTWAIGIFRFLNHFFAFISYWFAGRVMKRFEPLKTLLSGKVFCHFFNFAAFGFPTVLSPALMAVTSIFYGFKCTAEDTLLQREFTDAQRATMGSLNALLGTLFFAVFAYGFGMLADGIGPAKALLIGELCLLPVLVLYVRLFAHHRKI